MARPLRVDIAGGWSHVFARGLNGMRIFADDRDRQHFLELLGSMVERYRVELHAFALMSNHYHLIVRTPDGNLSRCIQWLNQSFAAWFNVRHDRKGTFFQRPFGSVPIENAAWAYELSLYVHLNPLRIKALGLSKRQRQAVNVTGVAAKPSADEVTRRLKKLREYPWSSYRAYAGYVEAPGWLVTEEVLRRATRLKKERVATYRRDARDRVSGGGDPTRLEGLRDGLAIGSADFVRRIKELGSEIGLTRETSGKRRLRQRVTMEEVIAAVVKVKGEPWEQFRGRWGDPGASLVMWLARQYTGLTLREIGQAVGGKDYAAVAMSIRRLAAHLRRDKALYQETARACQVLNVKMSPL